MRARSQIGRCFGMDYRYMNMLLCMYRMYGNVCRMIMLLCYSRLGMVDRWRMNMLMSALVVEDMPMAVCRLKTAGCPVSVGLSRRGA